MTLLNNEMVNEKLDPLRFEDFKRSELAIDIIARMIGYNINDRLREKSKINPDPLILNKLEEQRDILLSEQKLIYRGNKDVMIACIEKYVPVIRTIFNTV